VLAGECITVTRNGTPVAELRALPRRRLRAAELVERFKRVPPVDPSRLRADVGRLGCPAVVGRRMSGRRFDAGSAHASAHDVTRWLM